MVYTRKRKTPYGRRRKSTRRIRRRKTVKINRPFADNKIVKMRYCDNITLDAGAAGAGVLHRFNANSVFDPDLTGTGHQPLGYDECAVLWTHYTVLGARMRVMATTNADSTAPMMLTLQLTSSPGSLPSITTFIEQKRGSYTIIGRGTGGASKGVVTCNYSGKKHFGVKDLNATTQKAVFGASPSDEALFELGVQALDANDPSPIHCLVVIDYIVQMSEPKLLSQS